MEVVPVNVLERLYTVVVAIVAMLLFSSLVSSITNVMTNLHGSHNSRVGSSRIVVGLVSHSHRSFLSDLSAVTAVLICFRLCGMSLALESGEGASGLLLLL